MTNVVLPILLIVLSYLFGCFSTARIVAKTFKNLKITKVGTGHPDTANIYCNVSKVLGIFVGLLDVTKMYFFLVFLYYAMSFLQLPFAHYRWLLLFGAMTIIGHCMPVTRRFKGGRGTFTYLGYIAFFAFWPMVVASFIALIIVWKFKQVRFSQYMVVLLPILLVYISNMFVARSHGFVFPNFAIISPSPNFAYFCFSAILMGVLNLVLSKRLGEI